MKNSLKNTHLLSRNALVQLVCILLLIGFPFFFLGGPGYHGSRSFVAFWNLGHVLFFFLTAWLLIKLYRYQFAQPSVLNLQFYVFLTVLVLGIGVEGLQMFLGGRFPDVYDVFRNQLGCLIALAFFCSDKRRRKRGLLVSFRFSILILAGIAIYPLGRAVIDEQTAMRQFPLLSDFETVFEKYRWKEKELLAVEKGIASHGHHSLRVQLNTDTYSGVSLFYFPGNWQGYRNLHASVYFPDDGQLDLVCRIHDSDHTNEYSDRFNRRFVLGPGWNDLVIPLETVQNAPVNRLLDLRKIESLGFFVVRQKEDRVIYIDNVYLGR